MFFQRVESTPFPINVLFFLMKCVVYWFFLIFLVKHITIAGSHSVLFYVFLIFWGGGRGREGGFWMVRAISWTSHKPCFPLDTTINFIHLFSNILRVVSSVPPK